MKKFKIVPRVCKETNEIELFYNIERKELVCNDQNEGHVSATYGYYLQKTMKVPEHRTDEANIIAKCYIGDEAAIYTVSLKL